MIGVERQLPGNRDAAFGPFFIAETPGIELMLDGKFQEALLAAG